MFCPNCDYFLLPLAENKKTGPFWMTITVRLNMITKQIIHFPHLLIKIYLLVHFISASQNSKDLQNSIPWVSPLALCFDLMTLSNVSTEISISYIKFANFWYIKSYVPNLIPLWPNSIKYRYVIIKLSKNEKTSMHTSPSSFL